MTDVIVSDSLDEKVNAAYAGKVVRKDLVRKVKVGANVPVFVLIAGRGNEGTGEAQREGTTYLHR